MIIHHLQCQLGLLAYTFFLVFHDLQSHLVRWSRGRPSVVIDNRVSVAQRQTREPFRCCSILPLFRNEARWKKGCLESSALCLAFASTYIHSHLRTDELVVATVRLVEAYLLRNLLYSTVVYFKSRI
jgi:hypothetical protein